MTDVSGTSSVLTADQLLSRSRSKVTGEVDPNATSADGVLSAQDLLNRARDAANGIINPPVKQTISKKAASLTQAPAKPVPYTEQDWYIKAKVSQLKGQISLYATLPGLDPSGAIMDSLTKEVNDLVNKQKAKIKAANDEAAAKQKELDAANAQKDKSTSSADLLAKVQGTAATPPLSDAVQALLKKAQSVNTTA